MRLRMLLLLATVATAFAAGMAWPRATFAGSCIAGITMDDIAREDAAVLIGRVGAARADGAFDFAVERWFRGGEAAVVPMMGARQRLADGSEVWNTCGLDLKTGQRLILAAGRGEGAYVPSICSLSADADGDQGRQMIIDANRLFGPGFVPGTAPPTDDAGLPIVGIAIGSLALAALVVAVLLVARRERT